MNNEELEKEILNKGLTNPRVTLTQVKDAIVNEQYYLFPNTTVTICLLELTNGFTVTGESACAHPDNFDEELGRKIAKDKATDKIWALEAYLLKDKLYNGVIL